MPVYSSDDQPAVYSGRHTRKDLKMYRHRKILSGPDLISKWIWTYVSHPDSFKYVDNNGELIRRSNFTPYPSLIEAQKILGGGNFDIGYSVNKHKRWNLLEDQLIDSLHSLQNPSIGLRVSLLRVKADHRINRDYDRPELATDYTNDGVEVIDFRGYNGDHEVHIDKRNTRFVQLYDRDFDYARFNQGDVEMSTRHGRRKPYLRQRINVRKELNESSHRRMSFDERITHLVIKQQTYVPSARLYNMHKDFAPMHWEKSSRQRFHESINRKKPHRSQQKISKRHQPNCAKKASLSIVPRYCEWDTEWMMDCEENTSDDLTNHEPIEIASVKLSDLVISKPSQKRTDRRRIKSTNITSDEYDRWLHSHAHSSSEDGSANANNNSRTAVPALNNTEVEFEEENSSSAIPSILQSYLIPLDASCTDITSFVNSQPADYELIEDIHPKTFITELNDSCLSSLASFLSSVPSSSSSTLPSSHWIGSTQNFRGFLILQEVSSAAENGHKFIRCILNKRSVNENDSEGEFDKEDEQTANATGNDRVLRVDWSSFLPFKCLAERICCSRVEADRLAFARAVERFKEQLLEKQRKVADFGTENATVFESSPESIATKSYSTTDRCGICDESCGGDFIALECQHYFCRNCWTHYSYLKLQNASVPIKCLQYNCNEFLLPRHLLTMLPHEFSDRYEQLLRNIELTRLEWIYCDRCDSVIRVQAKIDRNAQRNMIAVCECGAAYCLKCSQPQHMPLPCEDARFYFNTIQINGSDFHVRSEDRSVMVKQCPDCGLFCQRIDGCNHMECPCGTDFCYVCGAHYFTADDAYHACNKDEHDFVRVDLLDIPRVAFNRVSLNVFEECISFRQQRQHAMLHAFRRNVNRILRHNKVDACRILKLYCAVCESLETGILGSYLMRRRLKHLRDDERMTLTKTSIRVSSLDGALRRLRFCFSQIIAKCEVPTTKASDLMRLTDLVESALKNYLLEASEQVQASSALIDIRNKF